MSLAQRAQASGSVLLEQRVAPPDLARLKSDVQRFVSVGDIAAMMSRQPRRARSELSGACRQAFQLPTWRAVPEGRLEELSASLVDEVFGFGPLEPLLARSHGDGNHGERPPKRVFRARWLFAAF